MKILVTGGAGFIGSHIVDAYIKAGHRVSVIDNESSGKKSQVNPRARFFKLDVRNTPAIKTHLKKYRYDVLNHHAAQIDVRRSVEDPAFDAEVNIMGFLRLLASASNYGVKKVLFASSGGTIYGECQRPARESDPEVPISPYGISKLASEKYIQFFSAIRGVDFTILRYANVYGPRQDPFGEAGVVAIFSKRLLSGEKCTIYGNGNQTRDFVFVGDVARANFLALTRGKNQILNIGSGKETSVKELYAVMANETGGAKKAHYKPARAGELKRSILNFSRAKTILGWKPQHSLRDGTILTLDYFRQIPL